MIHLNLSEPVPQSNQPGHEIPLQRPNIPLIVERLRIGLGNRYDILPPLAIGGMATIFPMQHRLHRGLFVAKVLHPWLAEHPGLLTSFRNEAVHGALLSGHPNIVPVIDVGEIDGLFYSIMPYIEGEDLDHLLARIGRLDRPEALMLAAQINSALSYATGKGVMHGDLATGNIRLDCFGTYYLIDFGLSSMQGDRTSGSEATKMHGGTPTYTSPEQLRGEPTDVRSDLYGLGVILFETLAGHPPFQASTLAELERKHLEGTWSMPPELEADVPLANLLRSLLALQPDDRMENPAVLAGALDALGCSLPSDRAWPRLQINLPAGKGGGRRRLTSADH